MNPNNMHGVQVAGSAVMFLTIFILVNGLLDGEFTSKYRPLLTSFAVSRLLVMVLLLHP